MRRLTGPEFKQLRGILNDRFNTVELLDELAIELRGELMDSIATGDNVPNILNKVIANAQAESWLIALIETAKNLGADSDGLQHLLDDLQPAQVLGEGDPYHAHILADGSAFVDREALRKALCALNAGTNILIVDGEEFSGKSYSVRLIRYIRDRTDNFKIIFVDLADLAAGTDTPIRAEDIAEQIAGQMKLQEDIPSRQNEQDGAWIQRFCVWLTRKLEDDTLVRWIVIDSFNKVLLTQGAQDLIKQLAKRITVNLPTLRLVLLGYQDALALKGIVYAEFPHESVMPFGEPELIEFMIKLYGARKKGKQIDFTQSEVADSVARVLRQVNLNDKRHLAALNAALVQEISHLI